MALTKEEIREMTLLALTKPEKNVESKAIKKYDKKEENGEWQTKK